MDNEREQKQERERKKTLVKNISGYKKCEINRGLKKCRAKIESRAESLV